MWIDFGVDVLFSINNFFFQAEEAAELTLLKRKTILVSKQKKT